MISGVYNQGFPGGYAAHLEDQIEEVNEEEWKKVIEEWGNVPLLPTQGMPLQMIPVWVVHPERLHLEGRRPKMSRAVASAHGVGLWP